MIELVFEVMGPPMGAVRQSRRDAWDPSKAVLRYRAWRDVVRAAFISARNRSGMRLPPADLAPDGINWVAYFPIPESWSQKKRAAAVGQKYQAVPDKDNIEKGFTDPIFKNDSRIYFGSSKKLYDDGRGARLEVTMIWEESQLP